MSNEYMNWSEALAYLGRHRTGAVGIRRVNWPEGMNLRGPEINSKEEPYLRHYTGDSKGARWRLFHWTGKRIKAGGLDTTDFLGARVWETYAPAPRTVKRLFVGGPWHGEIRECRPECTCQSPAWGGDYYVSTEYSSSRGFPCYTAMVWSSNEADIATDLVVQALRKNGVDVPAGD